jgi:transposase
VGVADGELEELPAEDVALKYKQLWMVEQMFRTAKSLLETRPIYHKRDEPIRGHVFCSFLALMLREELDERLERSRRRFEWEEIVSDLEALEQRVIEHEGKRFSVRSQVQGSCGWVFRAAGVAIPPTVQQLTD